MKASKFLHAVSLSAITAFTGLSSPTLADDIDIYLEAGQDIPQGDVGYWPTVMLSFDITSNATATFCQVDVTYDATANTYTFESTSADDPSDPANETDDCQRLINDGYLSQNSLGGLPSTATSFSIRQQVKRIELYAMALRKAIDNVVTGDVGLRIAMMMPHEQESVTSQRRNGSNSEYSDGGFIPIGFGPTQEAVDWLASWVNGGDPTDATDPLNLDCTAVTTGSTQDDNCGIAADALANFHYQQFTEVAKDVSTLHRGQHGANNPWHDWGGAEMYLELYKYVMGGRVFRGTKGWNDFSTSNAENSREDQPEEGNINATQTDFWHTPDTEFNDDTLVDSFGNPIEYDVAWDLQRNFFFSSAQGDVPLSRTIDVTQTGQGTPNRTTRLTYEPPPLKCDGINVLNFLHSQSSDNQPGTGGNDNDTYEPINGLATTDPNGGFYNEAAEEVDCKADDGTPTPDECGIELTDALIDAESTPNDVTKAVLRKMSNIDLLNDDTDHVHYDSSNPEGIQGFTSYFIFNSSNPSVQDMALATSGGGDGWGFSDLDELVAAIEAILLRILSQSSTFTAPALTANALNRTDILNDVFLALFQAETTPFWPGNVKKLRLAVDAAGNDVVAGVPTVNGGTKTFSNAFDGGQIAADVTTYWTDVSTLGAVADGETEATDTTDGRKVERGGAGQNLPGTRTIYTESAAGGSLVTFNTTNSGLTSDRVDFIYDPGSWDMGATLHSRPSAINYGFTENGASSSTREGNDNPDVRLIFGANDGLFRMLKNTNETADDVELNGNVQSGVEAWGFIPREVYDTIPRIRDEAVPGSYPGIPISMDGSPLVIQVDRNGDNRFTKFEDDGTTATNDLVWAFFGMRRGGKYYYALDLLEPDLPKFMWKIGKNTSGLSDSSYAGGTLTNQPSDAFVEMAQSWSVPQFAIMKVDPSNLPTGLCPGTDPCNVPVLAFGGGYNGDDFGFQGKDCSSPDAATAETILGDDTPNRGCSQTLTKDDDEGNAVFIVHAETGQLIWKLIGPSAAQSDGYNSTRFAFEDPELTDSVPSDIKFQDKDADGLADTLYFTTSGGDLWRINLTDMSIGNTNFAGFTANPPTYTPDDSDPANWRPFQLMQVGRNQPTSDSGTTVYGGGVDRRGMLQVAIASTRDDSGPYDAILWGTGDREDPLADPTDDVFYLYKDGATDKREAPYQRSTGPNAGAVAGDNIWTADDDLPIWDQDMAWVSPNLLQEDPADDSDNLTPFLRPDDGTALASDIDLKNGWRRGVTDPSEGEKVVGGALVIGGIAFYTTYLPTDPNTTDECVPTAGRGRLYALGIGDASPVIDLVGNDGVYDAYLSLETPGIPPPAISIGTGPGTGDTDKIYIQGEIIDTENRAFFPTFWRRDEEF